MFIHIPATPAQNLNATISDIDMRNIVNYQNDVSHSPLSPLAVPFSPLAAPELSASTFIESGDAI